jgi:hypothetical protein
MYDDIIRVLANPKHIPLKKLKAKFTGVTLPTPIATSQ